MKDEKPAASAIADAPKGSSDALHPSSFILHPLAQALADLGATEEDRPLLEGAARALAELGLGDDRCDKIP